MGDNQQTQTHRETLALLPVDALDPTPWNPRTVRTDTPKFAELLESVRGTGIRMRVQVRPKDGGRYETLAGARRTAAAQALGLSTVPATIHEGLSDEEAFELTFTENHAREDLTAIEQGRSVRLLLDRYGGDIDAVASKLGWSANAVRRRAQLTHLAAPWVELAETHEDISRWSPAHLELIARLPEEMQHDLADSARNDWWVQRVDTVKDLAAHIDGYMRVLRAAAWKLADDTLGGRPACDGCALRSDASAQASLFHEDADPKKAARDARCLSPECYEAKLAAFLRRRADELAAEHGALRCIAEGYPSYTRQQELEKDFGPLVEGYRRSFCKKTDPGAKPALVLDGKGVGSLKWIQETKSTSSAGPTMSAKEKREQEDFRIYNRVARNLDKALHKIDGEAFVNRAQSPSDALRQALALHSAISPRRQEGSAKHIREVYDETVSAGDIALAADLWEHDSRRDVANAFNMNRYSEKPPAARERMRYVSGLVGLDFAAVEREAIAHVLPKGRAAERLAKLGLADPAAEAPASQTRECCVCLEAIDGVPAAFAPNGPVCQTCQSEDKKLAKKIKKAKKKSGKKTAKKTRKAS